MTNYTPRALSTNRLQWVVTENGHGFSTGTVLAYNGTNYVRALADSATNAKAVGIVSLVLDANRFVITQTGYVSGLTYGAPFTPGTRYYLSENIIDIGKLVSVPPSTVGNVKLPLFDAVTASAGYFAINPGDVITPASQIPWQTATMSQGLAINNNYWVDSGAPLTLTMPASMGTSDAIEIACPAGGGGFIIDFTGAQVCDFINQQTSAGGTITLDTTLGVLGGSIKINCHTTDSGFMVTASTGNFIVA